MLASLANGDIRPQLSLRRGTLLPSRDILLQIMAGCFYHADTLRPRNLAFPLLGTGAAGFPQAMCLDTMMAYLIKALLFGAHTVEHVEIVLHKPRVR